MKLMRIGLQGHAETVVAVANTAKSMGSGDLEVFATPAMVALMEKAAVNALDLSRDQSSVGTAIKVSHTAASPIGAKVSAVAKLIEIDRRRLVFSVEASDEVGLIGTGVHERFIINIDSFLSNSKKRQQVK